MGHHANHLKNSKLGSSRGSGLAAFLDDLIARNLLKSTLVLVSTEFGRTPSINGMAGKRSTVHRLSVA